MSNATSEKVADKLTSWESFRQFWRIFASLPQCWLTLGRNLIPAIGVYLLGWSFDLVVFDIWFEGAVGLTAVFLALMFLNATGPLENNISRRHVVVSSIFGLLPMLVALAVPYLWVIGSKHAFINLPQIAALIVSSPSLFVVFGSIVVSQFWRVFAGIGTTKSTANILLSGFTFIARGLALMLILQVGFGRVVVPLVALALTVIEVLPEVWREMPDAGPTPSPHE